MGLKSYETQTFKPTGNQELETFTNWFFEMHENYPEFRRKILLTGKAISRAAKGPETPRGSLDITSVKKGVVSIVTVHILLY